MNLVLISVLLRILPSAADSNPFANPATSLQHPEDDGLLPETSEISIELDRKWTQYANSSNRFFPEWKLAQLRGNLYSPLDPELVRLNAADALPIPTTNSSGSGGNPPPSVRRRMISESGERKLLRGALGASQDDSGDGNRSSNNIGAESSSSLGSSNNASLATNSLIANLLADLLKGNTNGAATEGNQIADVFNTFLKDLNSMVVSGGTLIGVTTKAPTPSEEAIKSLMSILEGFGNLGVLGMQALNITNPLELIKIPVLTPRESS